MPRTLPTNRCGHESLYRCVVSQRLSPAHRLDQADSQSGIKTTRRPEASDFVQKPTVAMPCGVTLTPDGSFCANWKNSCTPTSVLTGGIVRVTDATPPLTGSG